MLALSLVVRVLRTDLDCVCHYFRFESCDSAFKAL